MRPATGHVVALVSGAVLSLAFPEPDLSFLAWVAIAPYLYLLRGATLKRAAGLSFSFGLGFFGTLLIWISIVGWVSWVVLVLLQTAFVVVFGVAVAVVGNRLTSTTMRVLVAASLWVTVVEYARAIVPIVGFTWGELAQSQHDYLWMLRPAALGGGWAVAGLVVAVNALMAEGVGRLERRSLSTALACVGVAGVLLAGPLLLPANEATGDLLRVAIVQGNIPRDMEPSLEKDSIILDNHLRLTEQLDDDVDLVVWPESSVAIDPERDLEAGEKVRAAAQAADAPMIVGGTSDIDARRYLVMAFNISRSGEIVDRYQKTHLVPFGEYVPGRSALDWISLLDQVPRDAIRGHEPTIFDVDGHPVATVLSFEGDFGSLVRERIDLGGRLLIVATNTSTWEDSWASAQHAAMSQVRAAETGSWVVHAALTGISSFVAPDGDVVQRSDLWVPATLIQEIRMATSITFYARAGDWLPMGAALFVVVVGGLSLVGRNKIGAA